MKEMNILYSIDEWKKDYSRYLWVSILSLLEHNKDENVHIYILSKNIEESNKQELIRIVEKYWKKITFSEWEIIPDKFMSVLFLKWNRPMATYYRLFFLEKFDIKDRVLYLDCDTIVNKNLSEFYNTDFEWNIIIWDKDTPIWFYLNSKKYWLSNYINAWVCLININLFKEKDLYKEVCKVNKEFWTPDYLDQGYINIIFQNKIKVYKNLQCIVVFKGEKYDINKYFILHVVNKPNLWWCSFCPKNIEKIFDEYLSKTKWKSYIWWEKKISFRERINYIYQLFQNYSVYTFTKIFWVRAWIFISNLFNNFWILISKILKAIKFFK